MVHKAVRLACNEEHGFGDVFFPEDEIFDPKYCNARVLRKAAKAAGWGRVNGGDYCPTCMDGMRDRGED